MPFGFEAAKEPHISRELKLERLEDSTKPVPSPPVLEGDSTPIRQGPAALWPLAFCVQILARVFKI